MMASAALRTDAPEILPPGTDIQVQVEARPEIVLLDPEKFDQFYSRVKAETEKLVPDTSTRKGREEIRSMAARVTRTKTLIDKARLTLTGEWRERTKQVNEAGKVIEARLETLADDVRKPLTEWEQADKARVARCTEAMESLRTAAIVTIEDTAATVRTRGKQVWETVIDPAEFDELAGQAEQLKATAVETLRAALVRLTREEAEREELARLRAEAEERERAEAERIVAEQAERERAEQERIAEERRIAAEKAEADKLERARQEAADQARRDAEAKAQAEREEADRARQAELDEANERARLAEEAAQRAREEEQARIAEANRIAAEDAAREANKRHRSAVKAAAKEAIMECGVDEDTARKIVTAIVAGKVPNITLRF